MVCFFILLRLRFFFFFFFQAEDGIRDYKVTGVQTCALPISPRGRRSGDCRPGPDGARLLRRARPGRDGRPRAPGGDAVTGARTRALGAGVAARSAWPSISAGTGTPKKASAVGARKE